MIARKAMNEKMDVTVVKTMMNSFCKDEVKALTWEDVLKDMNKLVLEAYVLVNIHVSRMCLQVPKYSNVWVWLVDSLLRHYLATIEKEVNLEKLDFL